MPRTFRDITGIVERRLEIRALTHEYEIISCFYDRESFTPTELLRQSSASSTAFYNALTRLELNEIIRSEVNTNDRRSKKYYLSDFTNNVLRDQWIDHDHNIKISKENRSEKKFILYRYFESATNVLKIRHLTCEYQILLLLSNVYGMTNIEITDLVDVSVTKFNNSLKSLEKQGLIYFEKDRSDKRKKHYYLTDRSKLAIDEWRKHMARWVEEKSMAPRAK